MLNITALFWSMLDWNRDIINIAPWICLALSGLQRINPIWIFSKMHHTLKCIQTQQQAMPMWYLDRK